MTSNADVAVLQIQVQELQNDVRELKEELEKHMDNEEKERKELLEAIQKLNNSQLKDKSFLGGIIFAVGALSAAVSLGLKYLHS